MVPRISVTKGGSEFEAYHLPSSRLGDDDTCVPAISLATQSDRFTSCGLPSPSTTMYLRMRDIF
jgi:hypothetical protein